MLFHQHMQSCDGCCSPTCTQNQCCCQVTVVFESIIAWDHRIAWDRRIDKRHNLNSTLAFSHTHKCHNESMIMNLNTLCITQFTKTDS